MVKRSMTAISVLCLLAMVLVMAPAATGAPTGTSEPEGNSTGTTTRQTMTSWRKPLADLDASGGFGLPIGLAVAALAGLVLVAAVWLLYRRRTA